MRRISRPRFERALGFVSTASLCLFALGAQSHAQNLQQYYLLADSSSPAALRSSLHQIIDDHRRYKYTDSRTDTWDILELAQQNPSNTSRILDIYRNASYPKYSGGNSSYDREHSWPTSYGFPRDVVSNYPYTDCHHLFLCYGSYNRSRSNKPFKNGSSGSAEKPTLYNNGIGGGTGRYPGNSNWTSSGQWETWRSRRGDIARALFYMDVRYEGGLHGVTRAQEPDLRLTNNTSLIAASSNTSSNATVAYMGLLSTLLQWHREDPVDAFERRRNDVIFMFQGNRNPFIDHPEWVDCVFSGSNCASGGAQRAWINEFHYDNRGSDRGEFVEIAGTAGLSLSGWKVLAYNGRDGKVYATINLSGTVPNQQNGYGTRAFFRSLQNGAPDGIALVDSSGSVVQFLSYEGSFVARNGAANTMRSTDVGVRETSSTSLGHSLQLVGTGNEAGDFRWQSPANDSPGQRNSGQSFTR